MNNQFDSCTECKGPIIFHTKWGCTFCGTSENPCPCKRHLTLGDKN